MVKSFQKPDQPSIILVFKSCMGLTSLGCFPSVNPMSIWYKNLATSFMQSTSSPSGSVLAYASKSCTSFFRKSAKSFPKVEAGLEWPGSSCVGCVCILYGPSSTLNPVFSYRSDYSRNAIHLRQSSAVLALYVCCPSSSSKSTAKFSDSDSRNLSQAFCSTLFMTKIFTLRG